MDHQHTSILIDENPKVNTALLDNECKHEINDDLFPTREELFQSNMLSIFQEASINNIKKPNKTMPPTQMPSKLITQFSSNRLKIYNKSKSKYLHVKAASTLQSSYRKPNQSLNSNKPLAILQKVIKNQHATHTNGFQIVRSYSYNKSHAVAGQRSKSISYEGKMPIKPTSFKFAMPTKAKQLGIYAQRQLDHHMDIRRLRTEQMSRAVLPIMRPHFVELKIDSDENRLRKLHQQMKCNIIKLQFSYSFSKIGKSIKDKVLNKDIL